MTSFRHLIGSARADLPRASLARWASIFFSLSILTFLISLSASQAFLAVATVAYAIHLLRERPTLRFPPVMLPLALFCLTTLLSVIWGETPTLGWLAVRKLVLFLIWLLSLNLVTSPSHLEVLWRGLFLESALAGLVAAGQFVAQYRAVRALHPDRIYYYLTIERIHGFLGHWMNFGGQQMLVFASLFAYLLLRARGAASSNPEPLDGGIRNVALPIASGQVPGGAPSDRRRRIWWGVLAIGAVSIVLNFTRGVWLGCFVAVAYLVYRWRRRWLLSLPVLLAAGYLVAPGLVRERIESVRRPSADPSLAMRFEMWRVGLRMIQKHPWLGVGPNNINEVYVLYMPSGKVPIPGFHAHLHNNFFQFGAERGLPCLAAWMWLMAALGWHFRKIRRRIVPWQWDVDAATASWLALLVEGCFEFNFGASPVLMLFLFITSTPFVVERFESPAVKPVTSDNG